MLIFTFLYAFDCVPGFGSDSIKCRFYNLEPYFSLLPVVEIDLKSPDLCHGKKYFENTKKSLANPILKKFNLALTWHSPDASVCSSSVAKYFVDQGFEVELQTPKVKRRSERDVTVPMLGDPDDATRDFCAFDEMVEFIGMSTLGCDRGRREATSTYQVYGETLVVGSMRVLTCKGMFTAELVEAVFEKLR
jgi:Ribonuclease P 40kDa (Rpp40) subunit